MWLLVSWWLLGVRLMTFIMAAGFPRLGEAVGWLTGYRVAWGLARSFGWHPFGG